MGQKMGGGCFAKDRNHMVRREGTQAGKVCNLDIWMGLLVL